jgi:hypothetical protein
MEVEHPDCQPWDDEDCYSMSAFIDRVCIFTSQSDDKQRLQQFLAPMNGDMKSLVSTALKHHHHAFYRTHPNLDCVIWNTHIMTVLSGISDLLRNAFLAQHSIRAVTKILVSLTAEAPSSETVSLKAHIHCGISCSR